MQKKILLLVLLMAITLVIPSVLAATTMTLPANYGNYSTSTSNVSVSVTIADQVGGSNAMTNVSCYYNASGGAVNQTTPFLLVAIANTTANQSSFTGAGTLATEGTTYNISCVVKNSTSLNTTLSATNIRIDGTDPVVSISTSKPSTTINGIQKLTWSSTDTYLKTTNVTVTSPNDARCSSRTFTSATSTDLQLNTTDLKCAGTYTVTIVGLDHSGNDASSSLTFKANAPGAGTGNIGSVYSDQEDESKSQPSNKTAIIVIIIIVVVAYLYYKKK